MHENRAFYSFCKVPVPTVMAVSSMAELNRSDAQIQGHWIIIALVELLKRLFSKKCVPVQLVSRLPDQDMA